MSAVSIVIPCFNGQATLAATIESALAQDIPDLEVIVIDDGSTDRSLQIARSFEPRVKVLAGPNSGVSSARNRGIAESKGDWLIFLDADDLLLAGTIEKRLTAAGERDNVVIVTNWECFGGGQEGQQSAKSIDWAAIDQDPERACAQGVWATTAALMYGRKVVTRIGGFREDLPIIQDARFMFDAAHFGARFVHADHVGARYRVDDQSLSRRRADRFALDCLRNGKQIEALWRDADALENGRRETLLDIYNAAGRTLFDCGDNAYFDALAAMRALQLPLPRHARVAGPMARLTGLKFARFLLGGGRSAQS